MILSAEFIATLKEHEGVVSHMYCDSLGYVTVGIGHYIGNRAQSAMDLPFVYKRTPGVKSFLAPATCTPETGVNIRRPHPTGPATQKHVKQEYRIIRSGNFDYKKAKRYAALELPDKVITTLFRQDVSKHLEKLTIDLTDHGVHFALLPIPVQEVLIDMAFNIGNTKFPANNWPSLMAAIRQRDWLAASKQVNRTRIQQSRNDWARNRMITAANSSFFDNPESNTYFA